MDLSLGLKTATNKDTSYLAINMSSDPVPWGQDKEKSKSHAFSTTNLCKICTFGWFR